MSKVNTGQASSTLIPKYIGSDFDKVVSVADNIEQVVIVSDNIEDVGTVADNINYVKEVAEDLHGMPVTMYTGENPPVLTPMPEGVMWYCTTDGRTYVWYTDADSGQWVESAPQSAMKDETTNIFFHATPSNVNPAYRSATLFSTSAPEAEISVAHNALNIPVVQAQFIREEALWVDVAVTGAQGIVTLMGYSSGNSQLKAEIITWKNGAEGTSLGASQWVNLPSQPSVVSLPVTLANIDVLDAGDSYVVRLTSQMNAGGSAVSTILVDGNTSSRFGIIFNTNLIGLFDGIRDGVITSAPTENAVYDALRLKASKTEVSDALQLKVENSQLAAPGGAELVGYSKGGNIASNLDLVVPENFDDTMYMSTHIFMFADQTLPLYVRSIFEDREDYTNRTLHFGVRDDIGGLYSVESDYAVNLDASRIPFPIPGEHCYVTSRLKHYEIDRRQRHQVYFRKVAPTAVLPNNMKYLVIGDSNTNIAFADLLNKTLRARGHNPTFVGTLTGQGLDGSETSGPLGEGRSAWSSSNFTHRVTTRPPVAIGGEAAYNAMTKSQKLNVNPFIIAGSGAGSFNGYKFDFASYLSRFGVDTPDVVGIGLGPNNLYLSNDFEQVATDFVDDLDIMTKSIWAVNPNIKIALYLRGMSKSEEQDTKYKMGHRWLQKKLIWFVRSHPQHAKNIWLISSWAHMSQEAGWTISTIVNTDGIIKGNITDRVHPRLAEDTRGAYVATVAPWMAWVAYASITRGYNNDPVHRQHTGGMGMLLGTAPAVFAVPAEQQSGTSLAQSIRSVSRANNTNFGPYNILGKSRGSESVPSNVIDGDGLGIFGSAGYVTDRFMMGALLEFYVDGTPVTGERVPSAARILIVRDTDRSSQAAIIFRSNGDIEAGLDNTQPLGTYAKRWSTVFAGTGTINTSDAREKTAPLPIDDAVLDAWGDVSLVTFKWLNAIQEKGEDVARWHFGVIAQQVRDAFAKHGLDGCDYGLLCYDEWKASDAVFDEDGNVVQEAMEAGNRWGIRPDQCLFLEAAYQRRRCDRIEQRLCAAGI